jgi:DNA polymerase-4
LQVPVGHHPKHGLEPINPGIPLIALAMRDAMTIMTIGELAVADPAALQDAFGRTYSEWLLRAAHGIDRRPVTTYRESKSFSRETTFERDLHPKGDRDALGKVFTDLCVRVSEDLRRKDYVGRTVGIKIRFQDFRTVTRNFTLPELTDEAMVIRRAATECLRRVKLDQRIRLLGVRVSTLEKKDVTQSPLPRQADLFDGV